MKIKRDTIVDQTNILPADRRKKFAEFRRAGYHCSAMVVVPDEVERADRAAKRVAATGKVRGLPLTCAHFDFSRSKFPRTC